MKRVAFVFLVSLVCLGRISAQDALLKKLTKLNLGYNSDSEYNKSIGVVDKIVFDQLLVGVKRDLPRIQIVNDEQSSVLGVSVLCADATGGLAVCDIRVELRRPASVRLDDNTLGESFVGTVWSRHTLSTAGSALMAEHVRQCISQSLTEFAADYYKQNPQQ